MATYQASMQFETICCTTCAQHFGVTTNFARSRREDGQNFYCPSGHHNYYGETEVARLQRALDAKKRREEILEAEVNRQREYKEAAQRSAAAAHGQVTTIKKRVANGACPCCKRSFADLHRHMTSQHPNYATTP